MVGLLGRNGAGKTTLIRIAMGMLYPHGGSVRVFGLSPIEDPVAVKKRVGYVAEDQVLPARFDRRRIDRFPSLSVPALGRGSRTPAARTLCTPLWLQDQAFQQGAGTSGGAAMRASAIGRSC